MGSRSALVALSILGLASAAGAQAIQVQGNPVQPGVPFSVTLTNTSAQGIPISAEPSFALLQPTGELIVPEVVGCAPVGQSLSPGFSTTLSFTAPATGPGSAGSFVLLYPYADGAVARVDVGAASAGFPRIHTYPAGMPYTGRGHHVAFPPAQTLDWELANTGVVPHTFAPGSVLELFFPGGTVAVATTDLAGLTVPGGRVTRVALPLTGLAPGPYTVRVQWVDPATGAATSVSHGIEAGSDAYVDLHFPAGKLVPLGGALPARLTMTGFFPPFDSLGRPQGALPDYVFVLGFRPGSTPLGGTIVPVVYDGFVKASINNSLFGFLGNNVGTSVPLGAYCAHSIDALPAASDIEVRHPNILAVSGLTFRAAVVGIDANGLYGASQGEEIVFE